MHADDARVSCFRNPFGVTALYSHLGFARAQRCDLSANDSLQSHVFASTRHCRIKTGAYAVHVLALVVQGASWSGRAPLLHLADTEIWARLPGLT